MKVPILILYLFIKRICFCSVNIGKKDTADHVMPFFQKIPLTSLGDKQEKVFVLIIFGGRAGFSSNPLPCQFHLGPKRRGFRKLRGLGPFLFCIFLSEAVLLYLPRGLHQSVFVTASTEMTRWIVIIRTMSSYVIIIL